MIVTKITSRKEADEAINQYGENEKKIKELQEDNKKLKDLFEKWATEKPKQAFDGNKMEGQTESFYYAMSTGTPALKADKDTTESQIVKNLKADGNMVKFVFETYDSKAIKTAFGGNAKNRKSIERFGLFFTTPKPHLVVEAL